MSNFKCPMTVQIGRQAPSPRELGNALPILLLDFLVIYVFPLLVAGGAAILGHGVNPYAAIAAVPRLGLFLAAYGFVAQQPVDVAEYEAAHLGDDVEEYNRDDDDLDQ